MVAKRTFQYMSVLFLLISISTTKAQKVEFIYSVSGIEQATEYKDQMKIKNATATNASTFANINDEKKNEYIKNLSGTTVVIIFGDAGVKAVQPIQYNVPVIIVNSLEGTSASGVVIRIFDKDYKGIIPKRCPKVDDPGSLTLNKSYLSGVVKEFGFICENNSPAIVKKIVSVLN